MSRRGKNPERDVARFVTNDLVRKVEVLMINRHMLMAPFPVPAEAVWKFCWTEKQIDAFHALAGTDVIKRQRVFTLTGVHVFDKPRKVKITCDADLPLPRDLQLPVSVLPDDMRAEIESWAPVWLKYKEQTEAIVAMVKNVGEECTTYGQLIRLWPDLQGFLGEYGAEKVHKMKAKSPYPEGVLEWEDDPNDDSRMICKGLRAEFKPEAFAPFTDMIAECLMLPVIDNLIYVGFVVNGP